MEKFSTLCRNLKIYILQYLYDYEINKIIYQSKKLPESMKIERNYLKVFLYLDSIVIRGEPFVNFHLNQPLFNFILKNTQKFQTEYEVLVEFYCKFLEQYVDYYQKNIFLVEQGSKESNKHLISILQKINKNKFIFHYYKNIEKSDQENHEFFENVVTLVPITFQEHPHKEITEFIINNNIEAYFDFYKYEGLNPIHKQFFPKNGVKNILFKNCYVENIKNVVDLSKNSLNGIIYDVRSNSDYFRRASQNVIDYESKFYKSELLKDLSCESFEANLYEFTREEILCLLNNPNINSIRDYNTLYHKNFINKNKVQDFNFPNLLRLQGLLITKENRDEIFKFLENNRQLEFLGYLEFYREIFWTSNEICKNFLEPFNRLEMKNLRKISLKMKTKDNSFIFKFFKNLPVLSYLEILLDFNSKHDHIPMSDKEATIFKIDEVCHLENCITLDYEFIHHLMINSQIEFYNLLFCNIIHFSELLDYINSKGILNFYLNKFSIVMFLDKKVEIDNFKEDSLLSQSQFQFDHLKVGNLNNLKFFKNSTFKHLTYITISNNKQAYTLLENKKIISIKIENSPFPLGNKCRRYLFPINSNDLKDLLDDSKKQCKRKKKK
jgi:hypothetical protein